MLSLQKLLVVASLMPAEAARSKHEYERVYHADELNFTKIEEHSKARQNPHVGGADGCVFSSQLKGKYKDEWVVGTGATACVWIAKKGGNPVAIKIAKGNGHQAEWQKECREMQQLRLDACTGGKESQQLAEAFLPTCLEVGQAGSDAYYVMQAAGTTGIADGAKKLKNNIPVQKAVFAQTVGAVYALHGIGWTHNDLHGHNIVMDNSNDIALIDFGEIKGHHRGLGYKHDVNSIWRWAAVLGNCPAKAQYPRLMKSFFSKKSKAELTERSQALLKCMKNKWKADAEFLKAFEVALTESIKITEDQHVEGLFRTKFIQKHLPALQNVYPWDGDGKCKASGLQVKKHVAAAPKKMGTGRPTKGDKVKELATGKCAEIIKDDKDPMSPYKIQYEDGTIKRQFLRVVQVAWASECA